MVVTRWNNNLLKIKANFVERQRHCQSDDGKTSRPPCGFRRPPDAMDPRQDINEKSLITEGKYAIASKVEIRDKRSFLTSSCLKASMFAW